MLHFSIRDVLWLTLVAALLVALWLDRCAAVSLKEANQRLRVKNAQLTRKNDTLTHRVHVDAISLKRLEAESRALADLNEGSRDHAAYWRSEYWKRAAFDPPH